MENIRIIIEGSGRHIHLKKEHLVKLFGENYELHPKKYLSQPTEFACEEKVNLVGKKSRFDGVTIIGPLRKDSQVELSLTDARVLGLNPPIRLSGDVKGSEQITIEGPNGKVELTEGVIIAERHIHLSVEAAKEFGLNDGDDVQVKVEGARALIFDGVPIRVRDTFVPRMHIDYDEMNAAALSNDCTGIIIKK